MVHSPLDGSCCPSHGDKGLSNKYSEQSWVWLGPVWDMVTGARLNTGVLKGKVIPGLSSGIDLPQEETDSVHNKTQLQTQELTASQWMFFTGSLTYTHLYGVRSVGSQRSLLLKRTAQHLPPLFLPLHVLPPWCTPPPQS